MRYLDPKWVADKGDKIRDCSLIGNKYFLGEITK